MILVMPVAGRGSRFLEVATENPEYLKPKPLISIKGKPMVQWAMETLTGSGFDIPPSKMIFICRKEQEDEHGLSDKLKDIFGWDINVLVQTTPLKGATDTVLVAKEFINVDEDLIVSDSDHYFDASNLYKAIQSKTKDVAGIIPVFQPPDKDPKWSFTLFDENNIASAVGEKDAELAAKGAWANIGGYYFSKGKEFVEEAEEMINSGEMYGAEGKKEFYIAPLYDRMIKKGKKIMVAKIPEVWGLGTPKDANHFIENFKDEASATE